MIVKSSEKVMADPFVTEYKNPFLRTASLPLDFVVVGANITGLACAYNLHCAGHRVKVYEQDDGVGNVRVYYILCYIAP